MMQLPHLLYFDGTGAAHSSSDEATILRRMAVLGQSAPPDDPQPARRKSEHLGPCATRSEVVVQLHGLSPEDSTKLLAFALGQSRKFHGYPDEGIARDLLHEAIYRAVTNPHEDHTGADDHDDSPSRKWYPQERDFLSFLKGSIKSIGSGKRKQDKKSVPIMDEKDPLPPPPPQPDQAIILAMARKDLSNRPDALTIFDMMMEGYTRAEICKGLEISKQAYDTVYRWISRVWGDYRK
jgi:hypothetical protein